MKHLVLLLAALALTFSTVACDNTVSKVDKIIDRTDKPGELDEKEVFEVFSEGSVFRACVEECSLAIMTHTIMRKLDQGDITESEVSLGLGFLTSDWATESTCHDKLTFYEEFENMSATPASKNGRTELARITKDAIKACAKSK